MMKKEQVPSESEREQAHKRAEMILKVRGGVMSASEAARALGISRKTYYKWEQRGLAAMLEGLYERNSGRPASPCDGEKEILKQTVTELEKEKKRKEQSEEIRNLLRSEAEKKG
jgi:transposase